MQKVARLFNEEVLTQEWVERHSGSSYDIQEGRLYDTIHLAPGDSLQPVSSHFFSNIGPSSGKTYADTNMQVRNTLLATQAFLVKQICYFIRPDVSPEDLAAVESEFAWEFWLANCNYGRGPLSATGLIKAAEITEERTPEVLAREEYLGSLGGISIENQMVFYSLFNGRPFRLSANGNGLHVTCVLRGLHAWGVS